MSEATPPAPPAKTAQTSKVFMVKKGSAEALKKRFSLARFVNVGEKLDLDKLPQPLHLRRDVEDREIRFLKRREAIATGQLNPETEAAGDTTRKKKNKAKLTLRYKNYHRKTLEEVLREKPWILEDGSKKRAYQGTPESVEGSYSIFLKEGKDFVVLPLADWFKFQLRTAKSKLTPEQAEAAWKEQEEKYKRDAEGSSVLRKRRATGEDEEDRAAVHSDDMEFSAFGDDGEEPAIKEEQEEGMKEDNEDFATAEKEEEEEAGREDFDFEVEMSDDDVLQIPEGEQEEEEIVKAPQISDEEREEKEPKAKEADEAEEEDEAKFHDSEEDTEKAVSETDKELKKVLKKAEKNQKTGAATATDSKSSEPAVAMETESLLREQPATADADAVATRGRKRTAEESPEAPSAKRPKTEQPTVSANKVAPPSTSTAPAATISTTTRWRPTLTPFEEQIRQVLVKKKRGASVRKITKLFKEELKDPQKKQEFVTSLKKLTTTKTNETNEKRVVLRPEYWF